MKVLFFLFSFCAIAISGCSSCPDSKILVGNYSYSLNGVPSTKYAMFIYPDGSYKHQVTGVDGKIFESKGKWEYDSVGCEILFRNFDEPSDGFPPGNWYSRVRADDGEIKLMYSSEENIYYSKKALPEKISKEYNGAGNVTKELALTGKETTLKLSYDFYKEPDKLIIYDQVGKELYHTGMKATTTNETETISLSNVTKLVFKIESKETNSKWKFSTEIK